MEIRELYSKIQNFASIACNLSIEDVVIENQRKPRDIKPYISFYLGNFRLVSQPIIRELNINGIQTIVTPTVCTVNFKAVSDELLEAEILLHSLRNAFNTELQNSIFNGELALHRVLKTVSAIPTVVDEQIESRAILALELSFNVTIKDNVGLIEHLHLTDVRLNKEYIINK